MGANDFRKCASPVLHLPLLTCLLLTSPPPGATIRRFSTSTLSPSPPPSCSPFAVSSNGRLSDEQWSTDLQQAVFSGPAHERNRLIFVLQIVVFFVLLYTLFDRSYQVGIGSAFGASYRESLNCNGEASLPRSWSTPLPLVAQVLLIALAPHGGLCCLAAVAPVARRKSCGQFDIAAFVHDLYCRSLITSPRHRFFRRLTKLPGDVRVVTNTFAGPPSASSYQFTGVLTAATPVLPCPCRVSNISPANHSQAQVSCTVVGFLRERVLPITGHRSPLELDS
ncbi:hypothetical protein NL676_009783 [Syzygium grande]|nr:hypothetical protein NL676_009783 [Syzygium grande]